MIDTSQTMVIQSSPAPNLMFGAVGLLMTGMFVAIAQLDAPVGKIAQILGWAGALISAVFTLLMLKRALSPPQPVVRLSSEGFWDKSIAREVVPWAAVQSIDPFRSSEILVIKIAPDVEAGLTQSRLIRWTRAGNAMLGAGGLRTGAFGKNISFGDLMSAYVAYAKAHAGP